ncbi:MAG: amidohydrolase [Oscillospiraceae bacterium]
MNDSEIENGYMQIQGTKISAIGKMENIKPTPGEEITDCKGALILPGFIDSHSHIGMWEDGLGFEGDDGNEETDPITPNMRAIDAVNPFDHCFFEAREAGITTVLTGPGSTNPIAGQWCAIKTQGTRIDDMVINSNVGMKFSLGENPKTTYNAKSQAPVTRMATAALIREQLQKAVRYMDDLKTADIDDEQDLPEYDAKCEALIPLLNRQTKAFFHAHRADDIFTAIRISKEFNLDYVIIHATEGYKIAKDLACENAHVIAGPIICDRSKPELRELTSKNAAILTSNKVMCAICTDHPVMPIQYLTMAAAVAVRDGLTRTDALRAITINAAKIVGIEDRVGSLEVGKDADFVVFEDDPLNPISKPKYVYIDGKSVI